MLHLLGEFEKQIGDNRIIIAAGINAGDNIRKNVTAFLRQFVPMIGLLHIHLQKIMAEDLLCKGCLDAADTLLGEIGFFPAE